MLCKKDTVAKDLAYLYANPPTLIETIDQFEELVASHQRANAQVAS
jgi:hypothetical protein